jgi:hypothetical protein
MSRGHGASRRRNYGRRQSELRRRNDHGMAIDLQGPIGWPRGTGWDLGTDAGVGRAETTSYPNGNQAAG